MVGGHFCYCNEMDINYLVLLNFCSEKVLSEIIM